MKTSYRLCLISFLVLAMDLYGIFNLKLECSFPFFKIYLFTMKLIVILKGIMGKIFVRETENCALFNVHSKCSLLFFIWDLRSGECCVIKLPFHIFLLD